MVEPLVSGLVSDPQKKPAFPKETGFQKHPLGESNLDFANLCFQVSYSFRAFLKYPTKYHKRSRNRAAC
jgi:hypothetical protein